MGEKRGFPLVAMFTVSAHLTGGVMFLTLLVGRTSVHTCIRTVMWSINVHNPCCACRFLSRQRQRVLSDWYGVVPRKGQCSENRVTKKHHPKKRRKTQSCIFSRRCHFLKSNDQCKLPCRNCWVSALCVRYACSVVFVCELLYFGLQDTTRMPMTVVVRETSCVHVGGAWVLQGRSETFEVDTKGNEVVTA